MTEDDLDFLARIVRRRSGLILPTNKTRFVAGQLAPVMRRFGFRTVDGLMAELRHGRDTLARAVTEAMTTNESSFFRDKAAFEHFRDLILPRLIEDRAQTRRLRIWCAACAAGQEPYSIAMLLDDARLVSKGWNIDLIATDLSAEMIARAEEGPLHPFRGPARAGDPPARRAFHAGRRKLARAREPAAHGDVPPVQPARFLWLAR